MRTYIATSRRAALSLDVAKLNGMLSHLAQRLGLLERLREEVTVAQLRDDLRLQAMVKYPLLIAIQICIDMANHIVAASRLPKAETYAQIFGRLAEAGMISQELSPGSGRRPAQPPGPRLYRDRGGRTLPRPPRGYRRPGALCPSSCSPIER